MDIPNTYTVSNNGILPMGHSIKTSSFFFKEVVFSQKFEATILNLSFKLNYY